MQDARDVLTAVLEDVKEAEVPDDLREVAFSKMFDLRAGTVTPAAPPAGGGGAGAPQTTVISGSEDHGDPLAAIAAKAGVSRESAAEVFTVHDGKVDLIVPAGKLSAEDARGTKEIALLIAGARQAGGLEEWTSWDTIRAVCGEFKRLDSANFAKTMRSMEDTFNYRKESDRKWLVKLARPGWEHFAVAVKRLGGES
ncbi:MAG: hypothetical protein ACJ77Z_20365 [Thermoleophilaceae bacterium]